MTYMISFNPNSGSGSMDSIVKNYNQEIQIPDNGFNPPTDRAFVSWNTSYDGNGTEYKAGSKYNLNEDLILYAIWKDKLIPQTFSGSYEVNVPAHTTNSRYISFNKGFSEIPKINIKAETTWGASASATEISRYGFKLNVTPSQDRGSPTIKVTWSASGYKEVTSKPKLSGNYEVTVAAGTTNWKNITFSKPFSKIPRIAVTVNTIHGASYSVSNVTTTGFSLGVTPNQATGVPSINVAWVAYEE